MQRIEFVLVVALLGANTLSDLFVQVVRLAREMGLLKLGTIAVDGTKVKASRYKAMSYERILKAEAELKAQIKALMDKAQAVGSPRRATCDDGDRPPLVKNWRPWCLGRSAGAR